MVSKTDVLSYDSGTISFLIELLVKLFNLKESDSEFLVFGAGFIFLLAWLNLMCYIILHEPKVLEYWKFPNMVVIVVTAMLGFSSFLVVSLGLLVLILISITFGGNAGQPTHASFMWSVFFTEIYMLALLFIKNPFDVFKVPRINWIINLFKVLIVFPTTAVRGLTLFIKKPIQEDPNKFSIPKKILEIILFNVKASVYILIVWYLLLGFDGVRQYTILLGDWRLPSFFLLLLFLLLIGFLLGQFRQSKN